MYRWYNEDRTAMFVQAERGGPIDMLPGPNSRLIKYLRSTYPHLNFDTIYKPRFARGNEHLHM